MKIILLIALVMMSTLSSESVLIETLPQNIAVWERHGHRIIDESNIFEYMDGAGELYLGYRFDHLQVTEYTTADTTPQILVEIYKMQSEQDAFGLLSLDWGGEPVEIARISELEVPPPVPAHHALYGAGLLRAWAGSYYFRVMAFRESPQSKAQILSLARTLASHLTIRSYPDVLYTLSAEIGAFHIIPDKVHYFRSHLVLNSLYYIGQDNILGLGQDSQAVLAFYKESATGTTLPSLIIDYPDTTRAHQAMDSIKSMVPGHSKEPVQGIWMGKTKEGWLGCLQEGSRFIITFEHSSPGTSKQFLQQFRRSHE